MVGASRTRLPPRVTAKWVKRASLPRVATCCDTWTVSAAQSRLVRGRRQIVDSVGGSTPTQLSVGVPPEAQMNARTDDDVDKTPAPKRTGRRAPAMLS